MFYEHLPGSGSTLPFVSLISMLIISTMDQLNRRQKRFVTEYLRNGGNGRLAAEKAGYKGSANALAVQSSRMLRNAKVRAALAEPLKQEEKLHERVVAELKVLAFHESTKEPSNGEKIKALDILAKTSGLYKDGTQLNVNLAQIIVELGAIARPVQWKDIPNPPVDYLPE